VVDDEDSDIVLYFVTEISGVVPGDIFCPLSGCEYVHVFILSFVYTCITVAIGEPVIKKG
jgi:hypothetical protein